VRHSVFSLDMCSLRIHSFRDPFFYDLEYSPTSKENIDRHASSARRLITPHSLILQMMLSRLQAARYRKPGLMRLIQRMILRSARNHQKMRSVTLPVEWIRR
jgi:phosphatidylinositol 4-kinase